MNSEDKEIQFQIAWENYWHQATTSKEQKKWWDIMFKRVYDCCLNIGKTKCYGIKVVDLEGKCMDAAIKCMSKINEGTRPKKLSAFCYLYTIGEVWAEKHQRWERAESFNGVFDNFAYEENEDGLLNICSSNY